MAETMSERFFEGPTGWEEEQAPVEAVEPVAEFERVSFLADNSVEPNYDKLADSARTSDAGSTLLVDILAQTGYIEPLATIAKNKNDYERKETAPLTAKLAVWSDVETRINQAKEFYSNFLVDPITGRIVNSDMLVAVYDETADYDDTSLLRILKEIRKHIPKPRDYAAGKKQPDVASNNIAEAERLIRLLILDETGKFSLIKQ